MIYMGMCYMWFKYDIPFLVLYERLFFYRNGDMLYLNNKSKSGADNNLDSGASTSAASNDEVMTTVGSHDMTVKEDEVDIELDKQDGKIQQDRNKQM